MRTITRFLVALTFACVSLAPLSTGAGAATATDPPPVERTGWGRVTLNHGQTISMTACRSSSAYHYLTVYAQGADPARFNLRITKNHRNPRTVTQNGVTHGAKWRIAQSCVPIHVTNLGARVTFDPQTYYERTCSCG